MLFRSRLANDDHEFNRFKEESEKNVQDFMNKFVNQENKRLEDFKERILEGSDLTEVDKKSLMNEYEGQLQKLQKQLLLDQSEANNHIKLYLDERKGRRKQLLDHKRKIDNEKASLKEKNSDLLNDVNKRFDRKEDEIDERINGDIERNRQEIEENHKQEADKLKKKYDNLLKKTSGAQKRVEIMDQYRQASKQLEEVYKQQIEIQLAGFNKSMEAKRKQDKEALKGEKHKERNDIITQCQKELDNIKEKESVIYNKVANVAIEEKVKEAKDNIASETKEDEAKLRKLKEDHEVEFKKLLMKEKETLARLSEEEAKDNEAIRDEIEKRKAKLIRMTRKNCEGLNKTRKKLKAEKKSPLTNEERKAAIEKELADIDNEIKKRIEDELLRQDMELTKMIEARRMKRIGEEIELKKDINREYLETDERCTIEEEKLKSEITETGFLRALEQLRGRMSPEE